jgi:pyruvate dehydrogenase E1 component alpha subunit
MSDIPNQLLLQKMLLIRMVENKIIELYPEQDMRCPVHLSIGQEAVSAGVCANLRNEDAVLSNHRSHGHYLAKGGDLKAMLAEIYGKIDGCSKGRGGSMHLTDSSVSFYGASSIVGGTIPLSVGIALGFSMQKKDNLSIVFFGDAAVEEGVLHESLNFAALKKLPVIFVCENNFYSVYSHISLRQPKREIYSLAKSHGIKSYQEDGMDARKVFELTKKSIEEMKKNGGPIFLEFLTYRYREHCGPNYDYDLGFRTEGEVRKWEKNCPLEKLEKQMLKERKITKKQIEEMKKNIKIEIEEAVSFAKKSEFPEKKDLVKYVYSK